MKIGASIAVALAAVAALWARNTPKKPAWKRLKPRYPDYRRGRKR